MLVANVDKNNVVHVEFNGLFSLVYDSDSCVFDLSNNRDHLATFTRELSSLECIHLLESLTRLSDGVPTGMVGLVERLQKELEKHLTGESHPVLGDLC